MPYKLKEVDQELQGGYMSIFLIRYGLKAQVRYALKAQGKVRQEPRGGYMSIFLIR